MIIILMNWIHGVKIKTCVINNDVFLPIHSPSRIQANIMSSKFKYYLRQLSKTQETNHFLLPWGGLCLRNCDENGDLVKFKSIREYRPLDNKMWLHLPLLLFRDRDNVSISSSYIKYILKISSYRVISSLCSDVQFAQKWNPWMD